MPDTGLRKLAAFAAFLMIFAASCYAIGPNAVLDVVPGVGETPE